MIRSGRLTGEEPLSAESAIPYIITISPLIHSIHNHLPKTIQHNFYQSQPIQIYFILIFQHYAENRSA